MEPEEVTDEVTPEPTDQEQEADFAAAFDEEPTETPATPEPAPEPATPEVPAQPEPEYVQLTKAELDAIKGGNAELKAALKTLEDRSNGSIGNLKQTLAQIQQATPAGQSVQFSADDFAELKRDFPEMSEHMVAALNRGMARLKGTGPVINDDMINARVTERLAPELERVRKDNALLVMDAIEPDWRQTVQSQPWLEWLSKQAPDYRQKVENSWELPEVRAAITKFKTDSKPKAPAPAPRINRFERAQVPRGAGGHSPTTTEQQEFEAAFNGK